MKFFAAVLMLLTIASAKDNSPVLMFIDGTSTPLARAVSAEKECAGLTLEGGLGSQGPTPQWAMAQSVGNGSGQYEIWLSSLNEKRHTFLGTNVKKAAKKACRIIKGKEQWAGLPNE